MPYVAEISRTNPSCFLFLVDQAGRPRKPVQPFVGAGKGDDDALLAAMRCHAKEERADPSAVLVVDGSAFPQKGHALLRRQASVGRPPG